ncbi:D-2-hydroxyacid dehydrogenase [Sphingomonas sp. PAMC 26605]|uniref:D-2-hydroxyacid dehydrogenase n=1 Tax=Sphingomonas sp. PAMC 26605 TaxID=1112214 RepID=UPI00026CCA63|nr:D-2-hydroxyacid dehydrogenase [Sphingomonas sp. PAMC 26605]
MKLVLPALARALLEPRLPAGLDTVWVATPAEATAAMADADIGWVDLYPHGLTPEAVAAGRSLKWLFTAIAGLDSLDLAELARRGTIVTNGTGINAIAVAEYTVLGMLAAAKRFDEVVRLADRHAWPDAAPGRIELFESRALIVGYGAIGTLVGERLKAFGVAVTGVTRSGRDGTLTPDAWKPRLGEFDWVILAAPSTGATKAVIGADELAAMKPSAWLINIARGDMVDQDALIAALTAKTIAGAYLDTVSPEPLPTDHPLWSAPNTIHSMHLAGRSQTRMFQRAAALFLRNLDAFLAGRAMENVVDLDAGY